MRISDAIAHLAATPRLLVALDFDGTLSPLVDDPMSARMTSQARDAIDALLAAPATDVALVWGRSLRDLRLIAEHDDSSAILLAGSHGAEYWPEPQDADDQDDAGRGGEEELRDELLVAARALAAADTGAWIEHKAFGFALHTRLLDAGRADLLQQEVDALVSTRAPQWRRRTGRDILEFASRHDGKDAALARLRAQLSATAVLFAGDDTTDEDALRSLGPDDVGVRVGPGDTAAAVRVDDIAELAAMLVRLAHERVAQRE